MTIQSHEKQLNILTSQTTNLDVYSVLKSRLIADWSVEYMNPVITSSGILLHANEETVQQPSNMCMTFWLNCVKVFYTILVRSDILELCIYVRLYQDFDTLRARYRIAVIVNCWMICWIINTKMSWLQDYKDRSGIILNNFSFHFDHPIIWKTVKYINQSNNKYWLVFGFKK